MAIPEEILKVERPKGTIIKHTSGFYYVVKRTSVYKDGRRVPKDLGTVGKIIDGKFVPYDNVVLKNEKEIDILSYGEVGLFDKAASSLLDELKLSFDKSVAEKLYIIAMLRAVNNDLTNRDLKHEYDHSFLSIMYPGVALAESALPTFFEDTGAAYLRIEGFMRNRVKASCGNTILIDGTLKSYNSKNSMFSDWSRKGRVKGSKDFSIIYSYNLNTGEPVAAKPYTGNMLDSTAFSEFGDHYIGENCLAILDKGFGSDDDKEVLVKTKGVKYLIPLKTNSKIIKDNNMVSNMKLLDGFKDDVILYNKVTIDNTFYYIFRSKNDEMIQYNAYMEKCQKKNSFDESKLAKKKNEFGVIVFESNYDTTPIEIYKAYQERWNIELMFKFYKNVLDIEPTGIKNDYRLYTTEFINYLSLIIASKVKKLLDSKKLLDTYSFKQIMRYIGKYKKCRVFDNRQKWVNSKLVGYTAKICKTLGIYEV